MLWIVGFVIFTAGPIVYSLYLAFTDYDIINEPEFVGTANFQQMMEDPRVRRALWNTFIFAVMKGLIGRFFLQSGDGTTVQDTLSRKWSERRVFRLAGVTSTKPVGVR